MANFRLLTDAEIAELKADGNFSSDWSLIEVSTDFSPSQIKHSRLEGVVRIDSKAKIIHSKVSNYHIGAGCVIDSVTSLECRDASCFGNGVEVATINENGGRTIKIYNSLTAQCGYIMAIYRHRTALIEAMESMVDSYAAEQKSTLGYIGEGSRVTNSKIIREVKVGRGVVIDGASILENATLCDGAKVGVDVKAYNFIAAEDSRIDNGSTIERCFVGECVIVSNGFTAVDSLLFASSHFENGEAASIFAGPYTVSHHKSSLLIAGIFSFFNAGSGSNQSNHLFKCGAVHQSAHLRGCKFSSSAYVMSPAQEAPFTTILGRHYTHHDTTQFPYSYLVEKEGQSQLIPAMNLANYGTVRDLDKWVKREKRKVKRDIVNMDEHNPYICQYIIEAIVGLNALKAASPQADRYNHNSVSISRKALDRALVLYIKALEVSLGSILNSGTAIDDTHGGRWLDIAGQYVSKVYVDSLLDQVESGEIQSLTQIDEQLHAFNSNYADHAHSWAMSFLKRKLARTPSAQDLDLVQQAATTSHEFLKKLSDADRLKDCSGAMTISYGLDCDGDKEAILADFNNVRGL